MKNRDIYISALHLIGEKADSEENCDYEERAPYLLSAFCTEAEATEKAYREYKTLGDPPEIDNVCIPLDLDFPRVDRFCRAATLYLAAMLIIDENPELSDKLFDKYCCAMATIQSEIPARIERIAEKYGAF